MTILLAVAVAWAGAPTWDDVRQAEIGRVGHRITGSLGVADVQVELFGTGPRRAPDGDLLPAPPLPPDAEAVARKAANDALTSLLSTAHGLGRDAAATPLPGAQGDGAPDGFPAPAWVGQHVAGLQALLAVAPERDALVSLRIQIGWCPTDTGWVACVRSPDVALGAGPPAITGTVFRKRRTNRRGAVVPRATTRVFTPFRYTATADGGWIDAPLPGVGSTFEEQAADAAARAAALWLTAAVGRRVARQQAAEIAAVGTE